MHEHLRKYRRSVVPLFAVLPRSVGNKSILSSFSFFVFFFFFSNVHAHLHKYRRFVVPFSFRSFSTNQAGIGTNNSCDAVVNRSSCSLRRCHHCIIEETTFAWAKMVVFFFRPIFVVDSCVHRCHSSSAPPSANHSEKIFLFLDAIFLVLK